MRIPFFQHIGIGVHISEKVIRWVELSRIGDNIKLRKSGFEQVENGNIRESLQRLAIKTDPDFNFVVTNLDASQIRQAVVDVPFLDDEEYLEQWINDQVSGLVPTSLPQNEFIVRHHFFGEEEQQKCLFVVARKKAVQERTELLNSIGLYPAACTSGSLEPGYALLFNNHFIQDESHLLSYFDDIPSLSDYHEGVLHSFRIFNVSGTSIVELIEEAETHIATEAHPGRPDVPQKKLFVATDKAEDLYKELAEIKKGRSFALFPVQPLSGIGSENNSPDPGYALAAGMAVKQLYPDMDTINLMEVQAQAEAKEHIQKRDAIQTGAVLGGVIVGLYLILSVIQLIIGYQLDATSERVALLEDKITAVNTAREEAETWKERVKDARQLVAQRTQVASLLEDIGRMLPDNVWYNEIDIMQSGQSFDVGLYGFSQNEAFIAGLMERLEKKDNITNVRLILSEHVSSSDVYESVISGRAIVRFQIQLTDM